MHQPGSEPEIAEGIFGPLSRLVDPSYDRAAAERSVRRAHAEKFHRRATKRQWVNEIDVVVDVGSRPPLRSAA